MSGPIVGLVPNDSAVVLTARRRRVSRRAEWYVRLATHLAVASIPLLAISAHVLVSVSLRTVAETVLLPLLIASSVLVVRRPDLSDRVLLAGFVWGLLACAGYDAFRLPTIYAAHWWNDFFGSVGGSAVGTKSDFLVGYLWRYVGDGGGIAVAFFALAATFGIGAWRRRAVIATAIAYAVCPVWTGLVLTDVLAPRGHKLFPLTLTTLALSLVGHLIYGLMLGVGYWKSRRLEALWPLRLKRPQAWPRAVSALTRIGAVLAAIACCVMVLPSMARAWVPGAPGEIAYASTDGRGVPGALHIWTMAADGSENQQLTAGADDWEPSWSPSGRKIVFSHSDDDGSGPLPEYRIWVMNADGTHAHALTPPGTPGADPLRGNFLPRYSPDGSRIAFVSYVPGRYPNSQIWVMNADGGGIHQVTNLPTTTIYALGWSPDGSKLVFEAYDISGSSDFITGRVHLRFYEMNSEGGDPHQLGFDPVEYDHTSANSCYGRGPKGIDWSPAGLVVGGCDNVHFAGGDEWSYAPRIHSDLCTDDPSWSPDGGDGLVCTGPSGSGFFALPDSDLQIIRTTPGSDSALRLTYGAPFHMQPSWGPAPSPGVARRSDVPSVFIPRPLERLDRTLLAVLHCQASAGRSGCVDHLTAVVRGAGGQRSGAYRLRAGTSRTIRLRLSKRLERSLRVGRKLVLRLSSHTHGSTTTARARTTVLAPAALNSTCPSQTHVGATVTLSGSLRPASPGAHAATTAVRERVGLVALSPSGPPETLTAKTDAQGHYSISVTPDQPGGWVLQVGWAGDRRHPSAFSRGCGLTVDPAPPAPESQPAPAPAPAATTLSLACPASGTTGSAVDVTGSLSPAISGATIRIVYTRQAAPADTITDMATVAADGTFEDRPVPDAPGSWRAQATYDGDQAQQASTSPACEFTVSPIATNLTLTCPAEASLGKALGVEGTLTPAFAGAPITLTYTHKTKGPVETFTSTVDTDASGAFADSSITPDDPGEWDVQASFAGDGTHAASSSETCATQVDQPGGQQ